MDIDYFKRYNDTYGHVAGDEGLKAVAGVLKRFAQGRDALTARYGGEEFAIILPGQSLATAYNLACAIIEAVNQLNISHHTSGVAQQRVTLSAGCSVQRPDDATTEPGLVERADEALYRAKRDGRNQAKCEKRHD